MGPIQHLRITELPGNIYFAPRLLFAWWDEVIKRNGAAVALEDKGLEYKIGREMWVASVFAACKRLETGVEHWVKPVKDTDPDAIVAFFPLEAKGRGQLMYPLEITTCGEHSTSLEEVLGKKLAKAYQAEVRVICYVTDDKHFKSLDMEALKQFVRENNPHNYEVWLLRAVENKPLYIGDVPMELRCLTMGASYTFDYMEAKKLANSGPYLQIGAQRSTSKLITPKGQLNLLFPDPPPKTT